MFRSIWMSTYWSKRNFKTCWWSLFQCLNCSRDPTIHLVNNLPLLCKHVYQIVVLGGIYWWYNKLQVTLKTHARNIKREHQINVSQKKQNQTINLQEKIKFLQLFFERSIYQWHLICSHITKDNEDLGKPCQYDISKFNFKEQTTNSKYDVPN